MSDALIVVDVQRDFCPGGALAVPDGDAVVGPINALMASHDGAVIATQDWHAAGHLSFASSHPGKSAFETTMMPYGEQVLWPDHCIAGSSGAAFHEDLEIDRAELIVRKGFRRKIDSYSAFFENDRETPTGLHGYLQTRSIDALIIAGLAYDFCVLYSALDAVRLGYQVTVRREACRAIDLDGSALAATQAMVGEGVVLT